MSSTRDFFAATFSDGLLPVLRRPVQDVLYETLDERQVPNRTDFKELRDLLNSLRGQVTGVAGGTRRLAETLDEANQRIDGIEEQMTTLSTRLDAVVARLDRLEAAESHRSANTVENVESMDGHVAEGME